MIRVIVRIMYQREGIVLLFAFLLSLLLSASVVAPDPPGGVQEILAAPTLPGTSGRHFYLTSDMYPATNVLSACASGYHMASLWEILDVSNLTYDHDHPAAYTQDDSGYGPPSAWLGWVRTGYSSSGTDTAGTGNCLAWSDATASNYGSAAMLSNAWEATPGDIFSWDTASFSCASIGPVWCAGDFQTMYLPLILR